MLSIHKFSSRSFDWILFVSVLLLIAVGLEAVYSVDLSRGAELVFFKKQSIACGIGIIVALFASMLHYSWFRAGAKLAYAVAFVLLTGVLIFGQKINGTRGWFVVGGFSFQPVEFAKVAIILLIAAIVAHFGRRFERPLFFFGTGGIALVLMLLIMRQPDLGSAIVIGVIWFGLMYLVGARRRHLVGLVVSGVVLSVVAWFFFFQDYQKDRVLNFIHPDRDPLVTGYNVTQSTIAVGAGKVFGRGLGFGSQSQLRFLPEAQTDFVFSVIGEELGFAGSAILVTLYGVILWRLIVIMQSANDDFVSATLAGIIVLFAAQFFINIGAEIGLLPVTGVTLPFVSYGGSSLIINLLLIGIAESMVVKKY
jgi:rod shape determining protein RodA